MNTEHDELERMLGQDLHQQVDGMSTVPFGFDQVKGRAHRIRRNRRIATGVGVAAALAVIVPVGLTIGGMPEAKDEIQPAPSPSVPAEVSRTTLTTAGLPRGDAPALEYFTPDGVVIPGEGTKPLPASYQALTPGTGGGWIALGPNREEIIYLTEDFQPDGSSPATGLGFATTPERDYVAWVLPTPGAQTIYLRSASAPEDVVTWELPESPRAGVVGILGPDSVVYELQTPQGRTRIGLATGGGTITTELPYLNALATDPVNGMISVQTSSTDNTGCFAVVEAATQTAAWETCDYKLGSFSPDGTYVMAIAADSDGAGPTMLSVLDARTGALVAEFASAGQNMVTLIRPAWESANTVVATASEGNVTTMVRMSVDGTLEEVADPVDGTAYDDVHYVIGEDRSVL